MIEIVFLMIFFLFVFPFVLSYVLALGKERLNIDLNYTKNPRYFAVSFRKKITRALTLASEISKHSRIEVQLSKKEYIKYGKFNNLTFNLFPNHIYVITNRSFTIKKGTVIKKEIYALYDLVIEDDCFLRAVACDGNCTIHNDVVIVRWIDAVKSLKVGSGCSLGVVGSSEGNLHIEAKNIFTRLYGHPITTYGVKDETPKEFSLIIEQTIRENPVEFEGIKSQPIYIKGDIFSDEDIKLKNVIVEGTIFSFKDIYLENVVVGSPDRKVSVIGEKIILGKNVKIYGYVQANIKCGRIE
ncbi:hypothetical protein [Persephonella sp. IF05-L8]|uniref:hypothetical protein n=1 Tax=Persephonella sp. IF05-L8 TaxID=1158338 RepID=UPI0004975972